MNLFGLPCLFPGIRPFDHPAESSQNRATNVNMYVCCLHGRMMICFLPLAFFFSPSCPPLNNGRSFHCTATVSRQEEEPQKENGKKSKKQSVTAVHPQSKTSGLCCLPSPLAQTIPIPEKQSISKEESQVLIDRMHARLLQAHNAGGLGMFWMMRMVLYVTRNVM